jgi:hypothetical protein
MREGARDASRLNLNRSKKFRLYIVDTRPWCFGWLPGQPGNDRARRAWPTPIKGGLFLRCGIS